MKRNKQDSAQDNTWLMLMVANFLLLGLFLAFFVGAALLTANACQVAPG
jgi:hypothetical protein